ncbi:unnamed protein product [Anisakis simplex]|uniref:C2H2-type domain-containing protein n=1 Tax=Anisakis simplex TaxID=6269 RepID=A0A0M3K8B0_ANISI|nr:unnamed protein product [Anisakis simplex]
MIRSLHSLAAESALQNLSDDQLKLTATLIGRWKSSPNIIVLEAMTRQCASNFVLYAMKGFTKDDMHVDFTLSFGSIGELMPFLDATVEWQTKWFIWKSIADEHIEMDCKDSSSSTLESIKKSRLHYCSMCDHVITSLVLHLEAAHSDRFRSLPIWMQE